MAEGEPGQEAGKIMFLLKAHAGGGWGHAEPPKLYVVLAAGGEGELSDPCIELQLTVTLLFVTFNSFVSFCYIWSCTFCTKKLTSERGMRYHITLHKTIIDNVVSEVSENTFGEDEDSVRTNIEEVDLANIEVDTVSDNIIVLQ